MTDPFHHSPGRLRAVVTTLGVVTTLALGVLACATPPPATLYENPQALRNQIDRDLRTLKGLRPAVVALDNDFTSLREQGGWTERGYFAALENDAMEHLLFRFVTAHSALWDISSAYQDMQITFEDPLLDAKAGVVFSQASLLLANHSAFLVAEFANDPIAIAKMNEAFYRSEIPLNTYYTLSREITSKRLSRLERAGTQTAQALADSESTLARLVASDPRSAAIV